MTDPVSLDTPPILRTQGRTLAQDLASLLNAYSQENGSDTPDFLLADYLLACLATWNTYVVQRDQWYGVTRGVPDTAGALYVGLGTPTPADAPPEGPAEGGEVKNVHTGTFLSHHVVPEGNDMSSPRE